MPAAARARRADICWFAGRVVIGRRRDSTGFAQTVARCGTCAPETVAPYPIEDHVSHGTEVASVAAAAHDGVGIQGMAPEATILALKIVAADPSGLTASSTTPVPEGTGPNAALIAPALGYAVAHGAFVTNVSVNGNVSGQTATNLRAAMDAVRQADGLVVESVSNVAGQDSYSGQIAETLVGTDGTNKSWFLFAIGINADGSARASNGNPGALASRMLAAVGYGVQAVGADGTLSTVDGNSFAAPAVAGAAALLKQYWPTLGGKTIAQILLDTATEAGAPGVDPVYGAGILNVAKAMQAQASAAAFSSAATVLGRFSSLVVSAPFGGATVGGALASKVDHMTVYDVYGRDFEIAAASGIRARGSSLLAGSMLAPVEPIGCGPARHPTLNSGNHPLPRSCDSTRGIHAGLLRPAQSLNQKAAPL